MQATISKFSGTFSFLSNFHLSTVELGGLPAPTVEHAFQAAKAQNFNDRIAILTAETPGQAKILGRRVALRPNWEEVKLWIMEDLLRQKFRDRYMRAALERTGDVLLIEGNTWGDTYWGVCLGQGSNHLGLLLMQIRSDYRNS